MRPLDVVQQQVWGCIALVVVTIGSVSGYAALAIPDDPSRHWAEDPLSAVAASLVDVDDFRGIRVDFRIEVPIDFLRTEGTDASTMDWGMTYTFDQFQDPHVMVRFQIMPRSLEDAVIPAA